MSEPDFLSQTGEAKTREQRAEWVIARSREGRAKGVCWQRFTFNGELLLYEGWIERPDDEGAPRFQYAAL